MMGQRHAELWPIFPPTRSNGAKIQPVLNPPDLKACIMKKIVVILGFLAFLASPAFAQPAKVDTAADAAVRKLFVSMNYRTVMINAMSQMTRSMPVMMRSSVASAIAADTRLNDAQRKQALQDVEKVLPQAMEVANKFLSDPALIDEMMDEMIPLYARAYTVAEIEQIAAFYSSPVGKKMLETMPQMMAAGMEAGQRIVTPRLQKLMAEVMKPLAK